MIDSVSAASLRSPSAEGQSPCPVCSSISASVFFEATAVPVHCNVLWPAADAARRARRGAIRLALCRDCGLTFNTAFDAGLVTYDESYENSLHYSPRFEAYADALARDLSDRFDLRERLVVEVGCGKGEFLRRLCRISGARGVGIDASYDPDVVPDTADDAVTFLREPFSSAPDGLQPALVFCRHVIEHLAEPRPFAGELAAAARRSNGHVFIEVPNVLFTLRDLGIWDIIYEHCSYFSAPALWRLCELGGLGVQRVYPAYGDQFLCSEATAEPPSRPHSFHDELSELVRLTARFAAEYRQKLAYWQSRLSQLHAERRVVVLWGAGSKGVTFVNTVPGGETVSCLVDLNPRKHGRFAPGTGHPVVAPGALTQIRPDVVVVMNPLYRDEIEQRARGLGLRCAVEVA